MTASPSSVPGKESLPAAAPGGPAPTSDPWAWHRRTLLDLRQRLVDGHRQHLRASATPADLDYNDLADIASEQTDRDALLAELGAEETRLAEVEAALQRLHAGTYGICEATGGIIPAERLRVLPWTRFTREAAERRERRES